MSKKNPYIIDFREEMSAINRRMRLLFESQVEVISNLPFEKVGSNILVLGSKGGVFANQVKTHFPECNVHGSDSISDLITVAKASYPEVIWQTSPMDELEYEDGFFDVVFLSHVLTYLVSEQDIYDVLKEVHRVVKSDGQFLLLEVDNNSYRGSEILQDLVSSYGMARGGTFYSTRIIERIMGDFGFALETSKKVTFNNKTYSEIPEISDSTVSMDRMSALGLLVYMGYLPQTMHLYRIFEKEYLTGRIHFELDYKILITKKVELPQKKSASPPITKPADVAEEVVQISNFSEEKVVVASAEIMKEDPPLIRPITRPPPITKSADVAEEVVQISNFSEEKVVVASRVEIPPVIDKAPSVASVPIEVAKKESPLIVKEEIIEPQKEHAPQTSSTEMELLGELTKVVQKKKEDRRVKRVEDLTKDIEDVDNAALKEVGRMLYASIRGVKLKTILVTSILLPMIHMLITGIQIFFRGDTVNPRRDFLLVPFSIIISLCISWSAYINLFFRQRPKNSTIEMLAIFTLMSTLLLAIVPLMGSKSFFIFFLNAWLMIVPIAFAGVAAGRTILTFVYLGIWITVVYQASMKFGFSYVHRSDGETVPLLSFMVILAGNTLIPFSVLFFESGVMASFTEKIPMVIQRLSEIAKGQKDMELENSRMSYELNAAKSIQEVGVPSVMELKQMSLCKVAAKMIPATEVGGDYYDIMEVNGTTVIGVGDVTDHGLKSGMVMLMAQSVLRSLVEVEKRGLEESLRTVNSLLYKNVQQRMGDQRNMTLLLSRIEPGKITVCGQHESVLIYRVSTGEVEEIDTEKLGFPVGLIEDISDSLKEISAPLYPGDTVLFYTDGIVEAENEKGEFFGLPLLCDVFKRHGTKDVEGILEGIFQDYKSFVGSATIYDDATAVVCRLV